MPDRSRLYQRLSVLFFALLMTTHALSQKQAVPSKPATGTKPAAPISARKIVELRKQVGKQTLVEGQIGRTSKSKSGHQFLNFEASELTVVCFKEDAKNFAKGQPADLYKGKRVQVQGKLELYRNKLQIKIKKPDQIQLATAASASNAASKNGNAKTNSDSDSETAAVEYLKKTDKETWVSPAGLIYKGRDPAGLTRVEHVMRHARDQPNRPGSHGVFDDGDSKTFQVIDEAWKQAKKRKTRPSVEGNRSTYTINLGRRVGYLGGKNGKRRRNPELKRVFIVIRTNTNEVVTAFPK